MMPTSVLLLRFVPALASTPAVTATRSLCCVYSCLAFSVWLKSSFGTLWTYERSSSQLCLIYAMLPACVLLPGFIVAVPASTPADTATRAYVAFAVFSLSGSAQILVGTLWLYERSSSQQCLRLLVAFGCCTAPVSLARATALLLVSAVVQIYFGAPSLYERSSSQWWLRLRLLLWIVRTTRLLLVGVGSHGPSCAAAYSRGQRALLVSFCANARVLLMPSFFLAQSSLWYTTLVVPLCGRGHVGRCCATLALSCAVVWLWGFLRLRFFYHAPALLHSVMCMAVKRAIIAPSRTISMALCAGDAAPRMSAFFSWHFVLTGGFDGKR